MMRYPSRFVSVALLLCSNFAYAGDLIGLLVPKLEAPAVLAALQQGGYVVYFRHGITERVKSNPDENDLSNCSVQRNLSAEGIAQTQAIGQALVNHKIPVGKVFSSPYCRCRDSALNITGKDPAIDPYLAWPVNVTPEQQQEYIGVLKTILSTAPDAGSNTLLVSHTANLQSTIGLRPKNEGDAFVFKPVDGGFEYIGHLPPDAWQ